MFPGYLFIKTSKDQIEFDTMLTLMYEQKDGVIIEADYSQLEVVVQGCLTNDKQLCEDLRNRIDFHCKRLSVKLGEPYEQVKYRAKTDSPDNPYYKEYHKTKKSNRLNDCSFFFIS